MALAEALHLFRVPPLETAPARRGDFSRWPPAMRIGYFPPGYNISGRQPSAGEMDATRQIPTFMSTDQKRHISQVVRDMGQRLMQFIRARVPTDADAEDVSQEVWQQLVVTLEAGPIQQVSAWLYTVARHRIIDRYRKPTMASLDAMADDADEETDFDFAGFFLRDDKTPRTEHLRHLFWEQLYAALAELPEAQRQVFMWHEFEAMSFQDIAALTGENVNTLLARKRYAVLHLRDRLEPLRAEFLSPSNP